MPQYLNPVAGRRRVPVPRGHVLRRGHERLPLPRWKPPERARQVRQDPAASASAAKATETPPPPPRHPSGAACARQQRLSWPNPRRREPAAPLAGLRE